MDSITFVFNKEIDYNFSAGFGLVGRIDTRKLDVLSKFQVKDENQELKFSLAFKDVTNNYDALLESIDRSVQYTYNYDDSWKGLGSALFRANGTNVFGLGITYQDKANKYNISGKWDDHEISGDLGFTHNLTDEFNVGFSVGTEKFGINSEYQLSFNKFKAEFEVDKRGKKFVGTSWTIDW